MKNIQTKLEFITILQNYISDIDTWFITRDIDTKYILIDHICYKCSTTDEFEMIRSWFEYQDKFVHQSIISKRRIAYIGFSTPLKSNIGDVWYLELSDQKPDNSQISKVDHIEIISDILNYDDLKAHIEKYDIDLLKDAKPHHTTYNFMADDMEVKLSTERLSKKIGEEEMKLY